MKILKFVIASVFLALLILFLPSKEVRVRESFSDEFNGAYREEIVENGNVVDVDLVASEGEIELIDGSTTKVWSYNNSIPGPEIRLKLGDRLKINFRNDLLQETTIHFHGMRVPNQMDGVPGVTQDPIKPGESFVYNFVPKDPGTFWFHPHVRTSEQVERGLYGVIVVEDDFKYSQDRVLVLDDWRILENHQIDPRFNTPHDLSHDGRWGNLVTVNSSSNYKLEGSPGERVRLRFVNTSNGRVYNLDFGQLKPKVIAVDGMYVKEVFDANNFDLAPGNRIDVDVIIPEEGIYAIYDVFTRGQIRLVSIIAKGEKVDTASFSYPLNRDVPDWEGVDEVLVDHKYVLNAKVIDNSIKWMINDRAFPDHQTLNLNYNEFNKIRFRNDSSRLHPMHIHGQFFKVISRNGSLANESFFRDTVLIYPKETVEIGIVPLDKGNWVNHCHILEHAAAGMTTLISVE